MRLFFLCSLLLLVAVFFVCLACVFICLPTTSFVCIKKKKLKHSSKRIRKCKREKRHYTHMHTHLQIHSASIMLNALNCIHLLCASFAIEWTIFFSSLSLFHSLKHTHMHTALWHDDLAFALWKLQLQLIAFIHAFFPSHISFIAQFLLLLLLFVVRCCCFSWEFVNVFTFHKAFI